MFGVFYEFIDCINSLALVTWIHIFPYVCIWFHLFYEFIYTSTWLSLIILGVTPWLLRMPKSESIWTNIKMQVTNYLNKLHVKLFQIVHHYLNLDVSCKSRYISVQTILFFLSKSSNLNHCHYPHLKLKSEAILCGQSDMCQNISWLFHDHFIVPFIPSN